MQPDISRYDIQPEGDDFVATKEFDGNDIAIFFCHCERGNGSYHLHRFENGKITSTEEREEFRRLLMDVDEKIDNFRSMKNKQDLVGRAVSILTALFSLVNLVFITDSFVNSKMIPGNILPSKFLNSNIGILLFAINVILIVLLFAVVIYPYYKQWRFDWTIESNMSDG